MNRLLVAAGMLLLLLQGCTKEKAIQPQAPTSTIPAFVTYTIAKSNHFSDKAGYVPFTKKSISFQVKFDSSAIYQTVNSANQYDVNKLLGFSEGNDHHLNSARIGWAWNKNALRLYAYVYTNGTMKFREIVTVGIGETIKCKIGIAENHYTFSVDNSYVELERWNTGPAVPGYMLYPYFGGDETAPHTITIQIMPLDT
jgi:hypothetical protein